MTKTLVGTIDPNEEPCPICHREVCNHTKEEKFIRQARINSANLAKDLPSSFHESVSQCPDNNPELIPEIRVDALKDMIAWFPKDKYVLEENEDGYIIYYHPKVS